MQPVLVIFYDLDGHVEFSGNLVRVAVIHAFRQGVFGWIDEQHGGLAPAALFELAAVAPVAGVVSVSPVDKLMHERAAFACVGDAPVDEHGVGGEAVYAVEFAGQSGAGHVQVWRDLIQDHAHLPVAHARRQRQRISRFHLTCRVDDAYTMNHDATFPCPYGHT